MKRPVILEVIKKPYGLHLQGVLFAFMAYSSTLKKEETNWLIHR
jgi:hypothetical protein